MPLPNMTIHERVVELMDIWNGGEPGWTIDDYVKQYLQRLEMATEEYRLTVEARIADQEARIAALEAQAQGGGG